MRYHQLERSLLFKNLPANELDYLAAKLKVIEIPPGAVLFRQGEVGRHFYSILSGEMEVVIGLGTEDERVLGTRGPGDFIGELSLLNPDSLRTASVRSRGPAQLLEISHEDVDALLNRHPQVAYNLLQIVSTRLSGTQGEMFVDLQERNRQLSQAYEELVQAQEKIIVKERLERELQVAFDIQMSILPQNLPQVPGFDFGARIAPARAVGGDFFDLFPLNSDKIAIVIGDVADKGVPSAIFMARTHAFLYAELGHSQRPAEVLRRVNHHLIQRDQSSLFVTVLLGILETKTGRLSYARAGHELPLVVSPAGEAVLTSHKQGQLLGFLDEPELDEQTLTIPPGGMVLFYTDGLVDGRDPAGEPFGYQRMMAEAASVRGCSAQKVCDHLWERLVSFRGPAPQDDDVTLLAVATGGTF
jgi:phosphoserine phosphatase RsbU/P